MNLQDIANFIDLVNNPAKYNQVLQNLQDEQGRLNAAIETVGKASELDKLRKQVEKERADLEATLQKKIKEAEVRLNSKLQIAAEAQKSADELQATSKALLTEAQQKEIKAKELADSFAGRDKELKNQEAFVKDQRAELAGLITEYNDKVSKLRAVMA